MRKTNKHAISLKSRSERKYYSIDVKTGEKNRIPSMLR